MCGQRSRSQFRFLSNRVLRLARSGKLDYAVSVVSGAFPPSPPSVIPGSIYISTYEGWRMTRRNTRVIIAVALGLCLPLTACKDAKTLQENEQLKAQVAQLQKENGQAVNDLESMTADRDALKKDNEQLKSEIKALKTKKKSASRKHHRS
jgi:cell division protein FtsB